MQNRYWKKMMHLKYEITYFSLYFTKCVKFLQRTKMGLAILSSAAIAAWAHFANLAILWGALIALSQVAGAIIEILPIQKRISELSSMIGQLSLLYVDMESKWNDVYSGNYSEEEINRVLYEFENKKTLIDNKYFSDDSFEKDEDIKKQAENELARYVDVTFKEDDHV